MSDWLLNLPVLWMAVVVFAATYLLAAVVYWVVTRLAVNERARTFKSVSPGMLPPLGILFALLVGFIAVEVWNNYDKAKVAVATEASARNSFPEPIINPSGHGLDFDAAVHDGNSTADTRGAGGATHCKAIGIEVDIGVINAEGKRVAQSIFGTSAQRVAIGPGAGFCSHRRNLVEQVELYVRPGPSPFAVSEPSSPSIPDATRHRGKQPDICAVAVGLRKERDS